MGEAADISPREAEVLELVGDHLSNAEIGARLYISVRTVETHVSSLLRKLDVSDRRALARCATERTRSDRHRPAPALPMRLTSFIGRESERAALATMLKEHRQVTAVGPGGVGKTRLALAVAADAADDFADGVWFVDLVPVTDPGMIATAVAEALGLGEQPGHDMAESVAAALADRHALLVLDNCEQVVDGAALFLERLLAACAQVRVLVTSRSRLMVPFERVYPVPPLSLSLSSADDGEGGDDSDDSRDRRDSKGSVVGGSDAVALFIDRAISVGRPLDPAQYDRVAEICARLDGMALAIELAAARYATLGLDGISAALAHPLRMLTGGSRAQDRHRSVRAALDWSHNLLDPADRALLRRVSVFVTPFTAPAAAQVTGLDAATVVDGLARLAEQSLLAVTFAPDGTRYRALETLRQYGADRLTEAGELHDTQARHLHWCLARSAELAAPREDWRARFDRAADELRAALAWAESRTEQRADAYRLARAMAELAFTRHLIAESQQRYEQAAALAITPADAAAMFRHAAAVAACRLHGDDMHRLNLAAADVARRAGDTVAAARDLAAAASNAYRFSSKFVTQLRPEEADALIADARALAGTDPSARAAVALAEAGRALTHAIGTTGTTEASDAATHTAGSSPGSPDSPGGPAVEEAIASAERAVQFARLEKDPLAESAALDTLAGALSWAGDAFAAAATARRRAELLVSEPDGSDAPYGPAGTHELIEALGEATEAALGVGDLPGARQWARRLAEHPQLAEVGHRATGWLLVADTLAGDTEQVLTTGLRFRDAWQRAGSPARAVLGPPAAAMATIHGLRDDQEARRDWRALLAQVDPSPWNTHGYGAVFDAILMLHQGRPEAALERTAPEPGQVRQWTTWIWLHWYVALRAEASVLAGAPEAAARLAKARTAVAGNPVATALVERATALLDADTERLIATASAFDAAGCRYQSARTLALAGGDHAARGARALTDLGLAPLITR
ncbi:ATP-binding protein [Streptomyces yangpuensis]|uniref:ATP-binding protein n=1 Tax=Streptomyces yangpuensis TaxID=1648182 RepID=UPI0006296894|nr:LuxR C-terminal-related transcriptional regulator [Streptomyces yangpuensis]